MSVTTEPEYYHCYECGARPDQHTSVMQKYDCSECGGRKCNIHTDIDVTYTCSDCGQTKLCNDCLAYGKCCMVFEDGEFHKRIRNVKSAVKSN